MARQREAQLAYSELKDQMTDESSRRRKAQKITAVLRHFFGREDLEGLKVVDLGCSTGYIADELAELGAKVVGVDIDVPGLAQAQQKFGERVTFLCSDGEKLPFPDGTVDLVIFNHIYEHVIDADKVMSEIQRILTPEGAVYLGLGNRLGIVEPHYKLPFLSYLPPAVADRYIRAFGRADHYHEQFRTRPGLRRMMGALHAWDYTLTILAEPRRFAAEDLVPGPLAKVPTKVWKLGHVMIPTYIWIASRSASGPRGPQTLSPPERVLR